ncbi:MFS transporter [Streptomyces sclerotialus]|uniref:MFS transporter n=1 Tax=Streptomyces sclerotialus TaxID=1957 RepID=UPI0004C8947B
MAAARDLRVLLRRRDFRRLLAVRLLSQAADGVYQVALASYVVFSPEKQASPAAIASAMAVLLLPYSVLGPFAGVFLDRWRRRQVLLHGNLLRTVLAAATALLLLAGVPDWLFYASALSVTAVNRFVLAGLSAALPRVVDNAEALVVANSLSPTAGTLAATAGGGLAFAVRLVGVESDAVSVLLGAALYLCAAGVALRIPPGLLGPDPRRVSPRLTAALLHTARELSAGLAHLRKRRSAARALTAMALMRFCYGALTITVLMLCRAYWPIHGPDGMASLGLAVAASGVGFFAAAVVTPTAVTRLTATGWIAVCAGAAAVLVPALSLSFTLTPVLVAAFALGLATQGAKIATDTEVQHAVDDAFRGRVFALYDVLFHTAFVGAAGVAALVLPPDGRSPALIVGVAVLHLAVALAMARARVSRETSRRPTQ